MCELCRQAPCHPRCPNADEPITEHECCICGAGIFEGEEYLVNEDGEFRHYDCFISFRELLSWLGFEVKKMNGND